MQHTTLHYTTPPTHRRTLASAHMQDYVRNPIVMSVLGQTFGGVDIKRIEIATLSWVSSEPHSDEVRSVH